MFKEENLKKKLQNQSYQWNCAGHQEFYSKKHLMRESK